MRVVLYTPDFEAITVLELPMWLLDQMERQGGANIAVYLPKGAPDEDKPLKPEIVTVFCEKLKWRDGTTKTILVTPNEELALSLRPEWLPGQVQAIQRYKHIIRELQVQLIKLGRQL